MMSNKKEAQNARITTPDEKDFKPVVKHLPEFPTKMDLSVPAQLTMGPEGQGFIGMTLSDCSITISEGEEEIGTVA